MDVVRTQLAQAQLEMVAARDRLHEMMIRAWPKGTVVEYRQMKGQRMASKGRVVGVEDGRLRLETMTGNMVRSVAIIDVETEPRA